MKSFQRGFLCQRNAEYAPQFINFEFTQQCQVFFGWKIFHKISKRRVSAQHRKICVYLIIDSILYFCQEKLVDPKKSLNKCFIKNYARL